MGVSSVPNALEFSDVEKTLGSRIESARTFVGLGAVGSHVGTEFPSTWLPVRVEVCTLRRVYMLGTASHSELAGSPSDFLALLKCPLRSKAPVLSPACSLES